jgi:hypothetical protein
VACSFITPWRWRIWSIVYGWRRGPVAAVAERGFTAMATGARGPMGAGRFRAGGMLDRPGGCGDLVL